MIQQIKPAARVYITSLQKQNFTVSQQSKSTKQFTTPGYTVGQAYIQSVTSETAYIRTCEAGLQKPIAILKNQPTCYGASLCRASSQSQPS
jgi:hypothetical protein